MHVVNTFRTSKGPPKFCIDLEADWLLILDEEAGNHLERYFSVAMATLFHSNKLYNRILLAEIIYYLNTCKSSMRPQTTKLKRCLCCHGNNFQFARGVSHIAIHQSNQCIKCELHILSQLNSCISLLPWYKDFQNNDFYR